MKLTIAEAADELGVSKDTIKDWLYRQPAGKALTPAGADSRRRVLIDQQTLLHYAKEQGYVVTTSPSDPAAPTARKDHSS